MPAEPLAPSPVNVYYIPPPGGGVNAFANYVANFAKIRTGYAEMVMAKRLSLMQPEDNRAAIEALLGQSQQYLQDAEARRQSLLAADEQELAALRKGIANRAKLDAELQRSHMTASASVQSGRLAAEASVFGSQVDAARDAMSARARTDKDLPEQDIPAAVQEQLRRFDQSLAFASDEADLGAAVEDFLREVQGASMSPEVRARVSGEVRASLITRAGNRPGALGLTGDNPADSPTIGVLMNRVAREIGEPVSPAGAESQSEGAGGARSTGADLPAPNLAGGVARGRVLGATPEEQAEIDRLRARIEEVRQQTPDEFLTPQQLDAMAKLQDRIAALDRRHGRIPEVDHIPAFIPDASPTFVDYLQGLATSDPSASLDVMGGARRATRAQARPTLASLIAGIADEQQARRPVVPAGAVGTTGADDDLSDLLSPPPTRAEPAGSVSDRTLRLDTEAVNRLLEAQPGDDDLAQWEAMVAEMKADRKRRMAGALGPRDMSTAQDGGR